MTFSIKEFHHTYDTESFDVKIGEHALRFLKPKSIDTFINPDNPMDGFPLWAKLWDAAAVLTHYLADLPVDPQRRILELGSGLGVAGISAAILGHDITLTEYDDNALNFLQANAATNNCPDIGIHRLDWLAPELEGQFDLIIGSEIIYQKRAISALDKLFQKYLATDGKVVLAERVRSTGAVFFEQMESTYDIRAQKRTLRSEEKSETVVLFELSLK